MQTTRRCRWKAKRSSPFPSPPLPNLGLSSCQCATFDLSVINTRSAPRCSRNKRALHAAPRQWLGDGGLGGRNTGCLLYRTTARANLGSKIHPMEGSTPVRPLATTYIDGEDRRFEVATEAHGAQSGAIQSDGMPAFSSPVRCEFCPHGSKSDNRARGAAGAVHAAE